MQRPVQAIVLTFELLHIRGSSRNSLCSNKKRKTNARYSVVLGGTRWYSAGFGAVLGGTRRYSVVLGGTRWYLKRYPMGFRIKLCLCFEIIDTITIHFAFATSDCNLLHCILRCSLWCSYVRLGVVQRHCLTWFLAVLQKIELKCLTYSFVLSK